MATKSSQLFPTTRLRDLPVYNGTVGETDSVLLIQGNGAERRLPVQALLSSMENTLTSEDVVPTDPSNSGVDGQIAWDDTGVYTYYNGSWGKSPRVIAFWPDMTASSRFLLVNTEQELSEEEKKQGRNNLGMGSATTLAEGIVRLSTSISSGLSTVPTAGQVADYVRTQLEAYKIPTATSINPPAPGYTTAQMVYDYVRTQLVSNATTSAAGIVKLASSITQNGTGVVTAAQLYTYVRENMPSIAHATTSVYGTVQLATTISEGSPYVPTAGQVYSFVQTSLNNLTFNVADAGIGKRGTVVLTGSIKETATANDLELPTQQAIVNYVKKAIAEALKDYTPGTSSGGNNGGGTTTPGLVDLSNYQGDIHLRSKKGTTVLRYDETTSTLYIGQGVCKVVMQPNYKVEVLRSSGVVESEIITGENCNGGNPDGSEDTPTPTPAPTPTPGGSDIISGAWGWNAMLPAYMTIEPMAGDTIIEGDLFVIGSALIRSSLMQNVSIR